MRLVPVAAFIFLSAPVVGQAPALPSSSSSPQSSPTASSSAELPLVEPPISPPGIPPPTADLSPSALPDSELARLRADVSATLEIAEQIAKTQESEGSLVLKVRDGFLTNLLWELFGFKNTEKTIVGYAISLIGILGLVVKAAWSVSREGNPEPGWLRFLTSVYLVVVVVVFSLLVFSGGVASEIPASSSAARPLLEAATRLEAAIDEKLKELDARIRDLRIPDPAPEGWSSANQMAMASYIALRNEIRAVGSTSESAATMATKAAGRSTGWGWHLVIALLLVCVLAAQLLLISKSP